jgi:hypothetical protein
MIRKFFVSFLGVIGMSTFSFNAAAFTACNRALPTENPGFCSSFQQAATCHCAQRKDRPFPEAYCRNIKWLYGIMVSTYGSLNKACEIQTEASKQECIDDWTCYIFGGTDSNGRPCSSTQKACV